MFDVDHINGVMVLTPDVVRMNTVRAEAIREHVATDIGLTCKAFCLADSQGNLNGVELWAGDPAEREAFKESLTKAVFH